MPFADVITRKFRPPENQIQYDAEAEVEISDKYAYLKEMQYISVTNAETRREAYWAIINRGYKGKRVAVDIEDGILPSGNRRILCVGFSPKPGLAYVFVIHHRVGITVSAEERAANWRTVQKLLEDENILKIFHHGSYDYLELKKHGITVNGFDYDTEIGEYFYNPDAKAFGLQAIVDRRFPEFTGYKEVMAPEAMTPEYLATLSKNTKLTISRQFDLAKKKGELNFALVPWKKTVLYNGADCDVSKRIEITTRKSVRLPLMHVYRDAGIILSEMEKNGPLFDYRQHRRLMKLYPIRVQQTKKRLCEIAGDGKFNPASPKQVCKLLFETLGLDVPNKGKENSRVETLEILADTCEAAKLELDYRGDAKIESTYLNAFKLSADMHEGKLTTKWWLCGTRTGRLSSGKGRDAEAQAKGLVNLQNIVSNAQLQDMVISDDCWLEIYRKWQMDGEFTDKSWQEFEDLDVMLGFDEAQFEMRVVAQRSGDEELIAAFERGDDIHAEVGSNLTGLPKEELMEEGPERVAIKGMHFGIVYGLKGERLAVNINAEYKKRGMKKRVTKEWADELLEKYFTKYYKVRLMIEADQKQAEELGYVETMFGFRRPLNVEEQKAAGFEWEGAYWRNQASNTPIQGTAHQLMLLGLVNLERKPKKYKLLQRPKMEVHDALYFYNKLKELFDAVPLGIEMLEKEPVRMAREEFGIDWKVKLKADPKAGFRFGVMVKDIGREKGPKTIAEFLNRWCEKCKKVEAELKAEFVKLGLQNEN